VSVTELISVDPGMKVNGQCYRDVLLSKQMLPAIKHVAGDMFVLQQDNAPSHVSRTPLNCYSKKCWTSLVLISGHQTAKTWIWRIIRSGVLSGRECMNVVWTVDELKQCQIDVWNSLQQNVIDTAINEWRKRLRACVHADGQHFEHLLWAHVTDKSYGQIKYQ